MASAALLELAQFNFDRSPLVGEEDGGPSAGRPIVYHFVRNVIDRVRDPRGGLEARL
jgi:hypothetical protein